MDRRVHDIIYRPRTGEERASAVPGASIHLYSQLCDNVARGGIRRILSQMFKKGRKHIILLQDPDNMTSGHWMGLSIYPERREIYFFSSYGGKPDFEKRKWIPEDSLVQSHQNTDLFNDGLKEMMQDGWTVHYSQYRYQQEGDKTASCGVWTAAFLNSDLNPDDFWRYTTAYKLTPVEYYRAYFERSE